MCYPRMTKGGLFVLDSFLNPMSSSSLQKEKPPGKKSLVTKHGTLRS